MKNGRGGEKRGDGGGEWEEGGGGRFGSGGEGEKEERFWDGELVIFVFWGRKVGREGGFVKGGLSVGVKNVVWWVGWWGIF